MKDTMLSLIFANTKYKVFHLMQKYKTLAIKVGLIAAILALLASPLGQKYAEDIKPLIEMVISQ